MNLLQTTNHFVDAGSSRPQVDPSTEVTVKLAIVNYQVKLPNNFVLGVHDLASYLLQVSTLTYSVAFSWKIPNLCTWLSYVSVLLQGGGRGCQCYRP